jgi:hypothetical protein
MAETAHSNDVDDQTLLTDHVDSPHGHSRSRGLGPRASLLSTLATLPGLAHQLDHVIRGNHVAWPITPEVNPVIYSLVILGVILSLPGRDGIRCWTGVMPPGAGIFVFFHLSP